MAAQDLYPRRKRLHRAATGPAAELSKASAAGETVATRESLDVAGYIHDMTAQLEAMAIAGGLDLLAYFLGMARSEADLFVRTNVEDVSEDAEADGLVSDEVQARFESEDD
jgi:hypothetical protein